MPDGYALIVLDDEVGPSGKLNYEELALDEPEHLERVLSFPPERTIIMGEGENVRDAIALHAEKHVKMDKEEHIKVNQVWGYGNQEQQKKYGVIGTMYETIKEIKHEVLLARHAVELRKIGLVDISEIPDFDPNSIDINPKYHMYRENLNVTMIAVQLNRAAVPLRGGKLVAVRDGYYYTHNKNNWKQAWTTTKAHRKATATVWRMIKHPRVPKTAWGYLNNQLLLATLKTVNAWVPKRINFGKAWITYSGYDMEYIFGDTKELCTAIREHRMKFELGDIHISDEMMLRMYLSKNNLEPDVKWMIERLAKHRKVKLR